MQLHIKSHQSTIICTITFEPNQVLDFTKLLNNTIRDTDYFRLCFMLAMCESLGPFRLAARPFAAAHQHNSNTVTHTSNATSVSGVVASCNTFQNTGTKFGIMNKYSVQTILNKFSTAKSRKHYVLKALVLVSLCQQEHEM